MPRRELIALLERLELYIGSGFAPDQAISLAGEGMPVRRQHLMEKIRRHIEAGNHLAKALADCIRVPASAESLIRHGESSGGLARSLAAAHLLLQRQDELTRKCLSALAYPCVIGVFASMLTLGLMRGVMPQIIPMLRGLHVPLPFLTRGVIALSEGLVAYGLIAAGLICLAVSGFIIAYRKKTFFRLYAQNIFIRLPIIGGLIHSHAISIFLHACGSLIESGIPSAGAYAQTVGSLALLPFKSRLIAGIDEIERGVPLGTVLSQSPGKSLPPYLVPLISAGEMSGTLGASILRAASILDRDIEHTLKRLTALIEPVMMAGMGCAVGAIALSIMMPIYDISKVLQQ